MIRTTVRHFFPDFNRRLSDLDDPRDDRRWYYSVPHLAWLGLTMFLGAMGSREHLGNCSDTLAFLDNLLRLSGTNEAAVADRSAWETSRW